MSLSINPSYNIIGILILFSIIILTASYYKVLKENIYNYLIIFRILIIGCFTLLFLNPTILVKQNKNKKLSWNIYIDNSLSLNYYKQPSYDSYIKGISSFIQMIKNKNIDYKVNTFGSALDTSVEISKIKIDEHSTNIGLVFDDLNDGYEKNIAGAIIFTDGQINQGPLLSKFANYNEMPIHIVGIGDTIPMLDVSIKSVDIPPISVKGDDVNVEAIITSVGSLKERVNVTLFDDNNKLVGSKIINISGEESQEKVRFQIKPNKIGKNYYIIKCSALSDEINIQNNQQKVVLHVMKNQYNIALITGAPNFNTKLIKSYLNKGNNKIDHFLYRNNKFNPNIKRFWEKKYEVVIFDNNPISSNSDTWNSLVRIFTKKLISHNSSFFIIPGSETDVNSLNNYLNIINLEAVELTPENNKLSKWEFSENWYKGFSASTSKMNTNHYQSLPPQYPAFKLLQNSNSNNLSFANYNEINNINPLLILGEKKSVRYAFWNSIDLASVKYKLVNTKNSFVFEGIVSKIFNWMMKKGGSQEFIFRTDKNSYQQGEEVLLSGRSLDHDNNIINDGTVELFFNDKLLASRPLFLDMNKNEYKSRFWAPKPGKIEYIVKINRGLESYEISKGSFEVQESHIELNRIYLNQEKLKNISSTSGGEFIYWSDLDKLLEHIIVINKKDNFVLKYTLRYNYFFISTLLILMTIEWLLRRRLSLI